MMKQHLQQSMEMRSGRGAKPMLYLARRACRVCIEQGSHGKEEGGVESTVIQPHTLRGRK